MPRGRDALRGRVVSLRPLAEGDLATRAAWSSDVELLRSLGVAESEIGTNLRPDLEAQQAWLARRHLAGATPLAIEVAGRYVGDLDWDFDVRSRTADLTLYLGDPKDRGRGYGSEAVRLIAQHLFGAAGALRLTVSVVPSNQGALRFWQKLSFSEYGRGEGGLLLLELRRIDNPPQAAYIGLL